MIKKILVSQPKPASEKSPYFDIEKEYGVECVFRPFFKVEGLTAKEFRQQKINLLDYTAVVFTSRHAVDNYFKLAKEMRITIPEDMKYFCVIETIALYIQKYVQYRKRKNFFPETGLVTDLMPIIAKHGNEKYFVPQSSAHTDDMRRMLDETGVEHDEAVMYYTVANDFTPDEAFDYNMLVFFSPEGIHSLIKNFPHFEQGDIKVACLGTKTIKAAEEAGIHVDFQPTPELRSVPAIIEAYAKTLK